MSFKDLPNDARPRERLIALGAGALADAELLALLLRTGLRGKNVLQLSQELLDRFGGLSGLLHAGLDDLRQVKGLGGTAKRAELAAVLELARRAIAERLKERTVFDAPEAVKQYLQLHLAARQHEVFAALFLDAQHRLITMEELFRGTLTQNSIPYLRITPEASMTAATDRMSPLRQHPCDALALLDAHLEPVERRPHSRNPHTLLGPLHGLRRVCDCPVGARTH